MREVLKLKNVKRFSFYNHFHGERVNVIARKIGIGTDKSSEEWQVIEHDCSKTDEDYFPSMICDGWGDCPITGRDRRWYSWLAAAPTRLDTFWVNYS